MVSLFLYSPFKIWKHITGFLIKFFVLDINSKVQPSGESCKILMWSIRLVFEAWSQINVSIVAAVWIIP